MTKSEQKISRKQEILQALAHMLEVSAGDRITTAKLAQQVGFSEAALYRHFPSKSKMFEGLIEFIEETVFTRINLILSEEEMALPRLEQIMVLLLTFTERNPGITRILTGDALTGENERLQNRVVQFYDRLETQIKQIIREAEVREGIRPEIGVTAGANVLIAVVEGRIAQYVRSGFKRSPSDHWADQWQLITSQFFRPALATAP
ncbi:nucleoid occlusion factor SlmA [Halioxenophilus aromaticivorans]|uniref:Nucleoid occlusion factor SlmA n=1 Tax=Halioxenophilus aromaticivorans TaxID=1306992 RepID=A0AAV3TX91_9ALTE